MKPIWTIVGMLSAAAVLECASAAGADQSIITSQPTGAASKPENCHPGLFTEDIDVLSLGVIQGASKEKIHFFDDRGKCPAAGDQCARTAYLVPGNEVLVGGQASGFTCVWYQGAKREYVAWVPTKNVAVRQAPAVDSAKDWLGEWTYASNEIDIVQPKGAAPRGALKVESSLLWKGGKTSSGDPVVHTGELSAPLRAQGRSATASDEGCELKLLRIGRYLVARDNRQCGGVNVTHNGIYVRTSD